MTFNLIHLTNEQGVRERLRGTQIMVKWKGNTHKLITMYWEALHASNISVNQDSKNRTNKILKQSKIKNIKQISTNLR